MSGFDDILRRGVPKPRNPRTILAELHSPNAPHFLHGFGDPEVPFLVTHATRRLLEEAGLTGFTFAPVQIAKIATLGRRKRSSTAGEPEDAITKSKGVSGVVKPKLFAVYVTGLVEVVPKYKSGEHPSGMTSPFKVPIKRVPYDLWRPTYRDEPFGPWAFCSERLRAVCTAHDLSNIQFQSLEAFMRAWTQACKPRVWRLTSG